MKKLLLLCSILLIAFIARFYQLGSVPNGLQQDETSIGYNAYSILKTGRDEHNVFLPQNFEAFGEYKLPGYIYASVLPIAIFGLTPFAIRFTSSVSGFLSVIVIFFLTKEILDWMVSREHAPSKKMVEYLPYITAFLISINPWHIQFSRAAFEVMLANFFILCGVLFFIKGVNKSKMLYYFFSILFFCASVYTYNIARVFAPLLGLFLVFLARKEIAPYYKKFYISSGILSMLCLIPFFLGAASHGGTDSTLGTLIFTSAKVQAPLQEFRSYFALWPGILDKLFFNYFNLTALQYISNFFAHFSLSYYFINGTDGITSIGTTAYWYIFEIPLIIWGIIYLWSSRSRTSIFILGWILLLITVTSFTREPPQATRTFFLIFPITFCSSIGLYNLIEKICLFKNKKLAYATSFACLSVGLYFIFMYFASYYVRFPVFYAKNWRTGDRDVSLFIQAGGRQYDKIIIDKNSGFMYTSLLTYIQYPPNQFQKQAVWAPGDSEGFTYPVKFGKYEIRDIDWSKDINSPNTLIITTADRKPQDVAPLESIYYPMRPVVFNVGQNIIRYPISEIAYVLVDTNNAAKFRK